MNELVKVSAKKSDAKSMSSVSKPQRTALSQSSNSPIDQILFLQRTIGNQAVGRIIKSGALQAKLWIGQPGDVYEQQADRMAEQVMQMPEPNTQRKSKSEEVETDEAKEEQEETLQTKEEKLIKKSTNSAIIIRRDEGEALVPNIFNLGIGTVDNKSAKTFHGNASSGKNGISKPIMLAPGKWGDEKPIPGPGGEKLNDIDFIFPTKDSPINGKTDGAFKIGSHNATIIIDPKDPKNSKITDYSDYWPHDKAKGLTGYPAQEETEQQKGTTIQRKIVPQRLSLETGRAKDAIQIKHVTELHTVGVAQRQTVGRTKDELEVGTETEGRIERLQGRGAQLSDSVRAFMEPRFGYDFSHVRVHADAKAAEAARAVNAKAFTVGKDVVFGAGEYTPETTAGKRLLAHELSHVVQQGYGSSTLRSSSWTLRHINAEAAGAESRLKISAVQPVKDLQRQSEKSDNENKGLSCRVKNFKRNVNKWHQEWPGASGFFVMQLPVDFELELDRGCTRADCLIGQNMRGQVEYSEYKSIGRGIKIPKLEKKVSRFDSWVADAPPGKLYWWDGKNWHAGLGSWGTVLLGLFNEKATFKDEPGFTDPSLLPMLFRMGFRSGITDDSFPIFYGGVGRTGYFEFRTYVKDKATEKTVRELQWGILIDYENPGKGTNSSYP